MPVPSKKHSIRENKHSERLSTSFTFGLLSVLVACGSDDASSAATAVTADTTAPTVEFALQGDVAPNATTVVYLAEFSESLSADLKIADLNVNDGTITGVTPVSGTNNYEIAIELDSGVDGREIRPSLAAAAALTDAAGNQLSADPSYGTLFTADNHSPTATVNTVGSPALSAMQVTYSLGFSETVTGVTKDAITVMGGTISAVSGSGDTYQVTVDVTDGHDGVLYLTLTDSIEDEAGNDVNTSPTHTATHLLDHKEPGLPISAPEIVHVLNSSDNHTVTLGVHFVFDELVNLDIDFANASLTTQNDSALMPVLDPTPYYINENIVTLGTTTYAQSWAMLFEIRDGSLAFYWDQPTASVAFNIDFEATDFAGNQQSWTFTDTSPLSEWNV